MCAARRNHRGDVDVEVAINVFGDAAVVDRRGGVDSRLVSSIKRRSCLVLGWGIRTVTVIRG